jgi:hypothetical protein
MYLTIHPSSQIKKLDRHDIANNRQTLSHNVVSSTPRMSWLRTHNKYLTGHLFLFIITYHRIRETCITTGGTSEAETVYYTGAHPRSYWRSLYPISIVLCSVLRSLFVFLFFLAWPLSIHRFTVFDNVFGIFD